MRREKGITLVALIITIVVLVILVGVSINAMLNGGIIKNADTATTGYNKEQAKETMNLKITNIQMKTYAETQTMPTLQDLADGLCEDDEMQYVKLKNKNMAALNKINVGEATSIYTKLKAYPYEFEIDSSLRLASIDGVKVGSTDEENITISKSEYESLKSDVENLKTQVSSLISIETYTFENPYLKNVVFKKTGNVKEIKIAEGTKENVTLTAGTTYTLGTLPEEYRPSINVNNNFIMGATTSVIKTANIIIYTTGEVTITPYADRTTSTGIPLTLTYI